MTWKTKELLKEGKLNNLISTSFERVLILSNRKRNGGMFFGCEISVKSVCLSHSLFSEAVILVDAKLGEKVRTGNFVIFG